MTSTIRIGVLLFILGSAAGTPAQAGTDALPLGTPGLLSFAQMTSGATPQLRIVDRTIVSPPLEGSRAALNASFTLARAGGSTSRLGRGMEVLARYSSYRADDSPTPWEEGLPRPSDEAHDRLRAFAHTRAVEHAVADEADASGLAFSSALARDPREGVAWSGPVRADETRSLINDLDGSSSSLVRSVARVATPILEVADALRAVRLNQIRLSDDLTLKLNGRTGRHARCFAIVTHHF